MYLGENLYFLVGPARSGTTLLGENILSKNKKITYLSEPKYYFDYLDYNLSNDFISQNIKTNRISILRKIYKDLNKTDILVDKTPSNVFRLDTIVKVFPKAKFIFIVRNPRDIKKSAIREWYGKKGAKESIKNRKGSSLNQIITGIKVFSRINHRIWDLRSFYISFLNVERYIGFCFRKFNLIINPWGPRYKGIWKDLILNGVDFTTSKQALESLKSIEQFTIKIPQNKFIILKYELLIKKESDTIKRLKKFLNIEYLDLSKIISSSTIAKNQILNLKLEVSFEKTLRYFNYK